MKKLFTIALVLLLSACTQKNEDERLKVVTTFFPYHSMTSSLIDDTVDLKNIMPLSMEIHDYEPSPKDIELLEHADLLIAHGADLEEWLDKVVSSLSNKDLKVVYMADAVDLLPQDPHTWLNPENGLKQFSMIKDSLIEIDPNNSDTYNKRFEEQRRQYDSLIDSYKSLASYTGQHIIVDHLAYNYLLSPIGLIQKSYMGDFHSSEPTAKDIEAMIQMIQDLDVKVIYQTRFSESKTVDLLVKETKVDVLELDTLEMVSDDKDTYIGLMSKNLEVLIKGLSHE